MIKWVISLFRKNSICCDGRTEKKTAISVCLSEWNLQIVVRWATSCVNQPSLIFILFSGDGEEQMSAAKTCKSHFKMRGGINMREAKTMIATTTTTQHSDNLLEFSEPVKAIVRHNKHRRKRIDTQGNRKGGGVVGGDGGCESRWVSSLNGAH